MTAERLGAIPRSPEHNRGHARQMRHTTRERARERLAKERFLFRPNTGGDVAVCLVYPNTYPVGMANLGFQAVFEILSCHPRVRCERAFLPDRDQPRAEVVSLESGRPLREFEIVAFSISFETDYLHVVDILAAAGIAPLRDARSGGPLVIAGGVPPLVGVSRLGQVG